MEKFGILTNEFINAEPQHYLKFALPSDGRDDFERENVLNFLIPRIPYKPNFDHGHKKVLCSSISRKEDRKVELICSAIGHDWKFWNSSRVETPLITAILTGNILLSFRR